jgi:molecular chaperone DnaK
MAKVIGIDLASCMSVVSVYENGQAVVIPNEEGSRSTPSVIALRDGERKVGTVAKRQQVVYPKETVYIIKRFMGLNYDDPDCKKAIEHVNYDIVNSNGKPKAKIGGREYSPEELSSMIVHKMKSIAEDYLGETVKKAILTCPAYFTNEQREATKLAGELAGLEVLRVISEPTAALLASNLDLKDEKKVMVVDYGGSTLDFSVAEVSNDIIEIKASYGDMFCGGSDIDKIISDYLISEFKKDNEVDLNNDITAKQRILEAAEKAKIELSSTSQTEINLPYITATNAGPLHLTYTLTRASFEKLISDEIDKVVGCGKKALGKANVNANDLDGILLVGGSCRIPLLQDKLEKTFNTKLYKTANLDECVSQGAAIQGSILSGEKNDVLLLDVTPLTLSLETSGEIATHMVEANTTIPCKKTQIFTTAVDNQPSVTIRVAQGERPMFNDNKFLGQFNLDGILPARRGIPQIEVTFDIDANGILTVSAKDKGTGKEHHISIEQRGNLSDVEIERIKNEAKEFEREDKEQKEKVEKLNKADSLVFQTEKQFEDLGDKLSDEDKKDFLPILDELKEAIKNKEVDKVDSFEKQLNELWVKLSTKLYSNAQGQGNDSNPLGGFNPNNFNFDNNSNPFTNGDFMKNAQGGNSSTDAQDVSFEEVP